MLKQITWEQSKMIPGWLRALKHSTSFPLVNSSEPKKFSLQSEISVKGKVFITGCCDVGNYHTQDWYQKCPWKQCLQKGIALAAFGRSDNVIFLVFWGFFKP